MPNLLGRPHAQDKRLFGSKEKGDQTSIEGKQYFPFQRNQIEKMSENYLA
jgi:hypothetical protein